MKILITGGAGFIASHLTERFLSQNFEVKVIDNFNTGNPANLPSNSNLSLVEGDISDKTLVESTFEEFLPDFVIHAAASYKDPNNWEEDVKTNAAGTINIVKSSLKNNVKRLVYFQTALCYGLKPKEQPITLSHPLNPVNSSYAISKTAGEQYIMMSGIEYISFRLANIIGPRNLSGPIASFFSRLSANKPCFVMNTRRDFIFVNDLVNVVDKAINGFGTKGVYHIASGSDYSIKEVFDGTIKAMNINLEKEVEVREPNPDDAFSILLDPSKTNKDFNWTPQTKLEDAIKAAVDWYKIHGVTQSYTHLKIEEKK